MSKMNEFDNILDECLGRLIDGESVGACLSRYPEYAAALEPLLRTAQQTLKAADILERFFDERGAILVDFKFEFGRDPSGQLLVGDELSPDSWRLWDKETKEILDKDRFRRGLPQVFELGYLEPLRRVCSGPSIFS